MDDRNPIPADRDQAVGALTEVHHRIHRGERVAPTKATFAEVAEAWLDSQTNLRPRTRDSYEGQLVVHVLPRFGHRRIADLTEDHIAAFVADMREGRLPDGTLRKQGGYAGWSTQAALIPLGRVFGYAARRGIIGQHPMLRLERDERPKIERAEMAILSREDIGKLLAAADDDERVLLATAVFTGLRLAELLGLTWSDVDFEGGVVRVRHQLSRQSERVKPKTRQAIRDVVLMPALATMLRELRLRSLFSAEDDFVFASASGKARDHTTPRRTLRRVRERAGLTGPFRFHDLRHTAASLLIANGGNVVFVSRQLGHAGPNITLGVYAHLFDQAEHAAQPAASLEAGFGAMLGKSAEQTAGNQRANGDVLPLAITAS